MEDILVPISNSIVSRNYIQLYPGIVMKDGIFRAVFTKAVRKFVIIPPTTSQYRKVRQKINLYVKRREITDNYTTMISPNSSNADIFIVFNAAPIE